MKHLCRSIAIAGHTGDRETVLSGLEHAAPEVRVVALSAAARLGILDSQTLSRFFVDPDPAVRYRVIEVAARSPFGIDVVPQLLHALDDPKLCEVSSFTLGELKLAGKQLGQVEQSLKQIALDHDDPLAREAAVAALGSLGCGLDAILEATDDVATVRRRAILALAPFEGDKVTAALAKGLTDRDWQVRQAAEDLTS